MTFEEEINARKEPLEKALRDIRSRDECKWGLGTTINIARIEEKLSILNFVLGVFKKTEAEHNKKLQPLIDAKDAKIQRALSLGKDYIKDPTKFDYNFLIKRLKDEVFELEFQVINTHVPKTAVNLYKKWQQDTIEEIADVSNFLDFIYCKVQGMKFEAFLKEEKRLEP